MEVAIRTRRLTKKFGRHLALSELDLDVPEGVVFGYLGPNGAGKTTTIRLPAGLIGPTAGFAMVEEASTGGRTAHVVAGSTAELVKTVAPYDVTNLASHEATWRRSSSTTTRPGDDDVFDAELFTLLLPALFLVYGIEFGVLALSVGALTGRRATAIALASVAYTAASVVYAAGLLLSRFESWQPYSPSHDIATAHGR